jgi:hypothetical protein
MEASVGPSLARVSSREGAAPTTADVRRAPRRGTPSRMRHKAYAPDAGTRDRRMRFGRRVLRSVLRPVRVDPHYAPRRKLRWWGVRFGITVGQTHASGRNQHWGRGERTLRGSPRVTAVVRQRRDTSRKGRRSRPPSLRGSRARVWLLAHRCTLQKSAGDVWPRISSANALQKERSGSSERGPSSERRSAGETVGSRVERKAQSRRRAHR